MELQTENRLSGEIEQPRTISVAGNELTIFVESPPLIAAMLEDIQSARERVWLETYILLNDAAGTAIAQALKEKARAGLDVRVLYDFIGSQSTPAAFFKELQEAGVQVHEFHSLWESLRRFALFGILNRRNHRKLLVVDDRAGYFGGMNVVDTTKGDPRIRDLPVGSSSGSRSLPVSAGWRDVHVRLVGPQQSELADSFQRSWRRAKGQRNPRRSKAYRSAILSTENESLQFFDCGPGRSNTRAGRIFTRLIRASRQALALSMAYFIPVGRVLDAIRAAARRGVRIQAIVPGVSDVKLVQRATQYLYRKLIPWGIDIYERQTTMLHSKVLTVDDRWTAVGSCNLDPRSLWINLEFLAVVRSPAFAAAVNEICAHEIRHSKRITLADCARLSWWQRLINRMAWSLRWWL